MDIVGMSSSESHREMSLAILDDLRLQTNVLLKVEMLKCLKDIILVENPLLLHEFLPRLMDFKTDGDVTIKTCIARVIEEVGLKHLQQIVVMTPALVAFLNDESSTVVQCAISASSKLFRNMFLELAKQGIYSRNVDKILEDAWRCLMNLKDIINGMTKENKSNGSQLLAIKFIEMTLILFTPDPNGDPQPPAEQNWDGHHFNSSWLVGHPVLDIVRLQQEADRDLAHLLENLQPERFLKISGPVAIVLVNCLAFVAKQRYATYDRIVPFLAGVWSICEGMRGPPRESVVRAVKNALLNLLKCTHTGAIFWREQLKSTLKSMNSLDVAEAVIRQTERTIRNAEKARTFRESHKTKDGPLQPLDHKRPLLQNERVSNKLEKNSRKRMRTVSNIVVEGLGDRQDSGAQSQGMNNESHFHYEVSQLRQMIDIIGALAAKGARAIASIELLITSLPPDMLADVVIESMKNLPSTAPVLFSGINGSGNAGIASNIGIQPCMVKSEKPLEAISSALKSETLSLTEHRRNPLKDPRRLDPRRVASVSPSLINVPAMNEELETDVQNVEHGEPVLKDENVKICSSPGIDSTIQGLQDENIKACCGPGIDSPIQVLKDEDVTAPIPEQINSPSGINEVEGRSKSLTISNNSLHDANIPVLDSSLMTRNNLNISLSTAVKRPTHLSSSETEDHLELLDFMDIAGTELALSSEHAGASAIETTDTVKSEGAPPQSEAVVKLMPALYLDDDQQSALRKLILQRIIGNYMIAEAVGAKDLHFRLLARDIAVADGDYEAVSVLKEYILADYIKRKGHELAMHVLYQLYVKKLFQMDELDSVSLVYEHFFIAVAEGLRDTLPPSDKSLSKFFCEAPMLPAVALKLLESLCNPVVGSKQELQPSSSDQISQGLSAVWVLILLRPPMRSECLEIVLKCAVHELDEVRTKAIRLVSKKLYDLPYASQRIEDFATSMLYSAVGMEGSMNQKTIQSSGDDEGLLQQPMEQFAKGEGALVAVSAPDILTSVGEDRQKAIKNPMLPREAQRCMSLYLTLCTKKISLLWQVFHIYESAPKAVRQAIYRNMPNLVQTVAPSSPELIQLISDPPSGSKNLIILMLHLLTERNPPSPELIATVKQLYESKTKDARLLIPILSSLSKSEVLPVFPRIVALPSEEFKDALDRILQGSVHTGPALTPVEVLIAIHEIDPEKDQIPLPMVKEACAICFEQRTVFTQQVLTKALNQLVEQTPVPMLFMRTVMLALGSFKTLVRFVMEILSRLVTKQIWKWPNLWVGFLKCATQTQPHSFYVLLQLPAQQLEKALSKHPNLRAPLTAYASKPNVRNVLPRSVLIVLGLVQDGLPSETMAASYICPDVSAKNDIDINREIPEPTTM